MKLAWTQSVTSRLETSWYRDFSQFFESIGLGLENFGLKKKSRYRSRKYLVSKKSLGIGLENMWSRKKSRIGLKNFGLGNGLKEFGFPTSPNMPNMPNNEQHV